VLCRVRVGDVHFEIFSTKTMSMEYVCFSNDRCAFGDMYAGGCEFVCVVVYFHQWIA
jgi:hypothetical protein